MSWNKQQLQQHARGSNKKAYILGFVLSSNGYILGLPRIENPT
jgi:hypothetical protein